MIKLGTITYASHFFKLTELVTDFRVVVERFTRRYVQYEMKQVNRQMVYGPSRVFADATLNRSEYRFHINQLNDFKEFLGFAGVNFSDLNEEYKPLPLTDKVEFFIQDKWKDRELQVPIIKYLLNDLPSNRKFVNLQTGKGKEAPLSSKIKVPGGWSTMGEMYVGKKITAWDGSVTEVIQIHPQGVKPVYEITFEDGRIAQCGAEHLWEVYITGKGIKAAWSIINTLELRSLLTDDNGKRLRIRLVESEITPDLDLAIDPYTLGVYLALGNVKGNCFCVDDDRTLNLLRNIDREELSDVYLHGSTIQRLALIQGLMDTSGQFVDDCLLFNTDSDLVANWLIYLIRSIGGTAELSTNAWINLVTGLSGTPNYLHTVLINHKVPTVLFKGPKHKRVVDEYNDDLKLEVVRVKEVEPEECQCISIAHPDHLYVTNDFIVTHNSYVTMRAVQELQGRVLIVIKPMYIEKWCEDLARTYSLDPGDIVTVQGSKQLMQLTQLAYNGELTAKIVIISNKTMQLWIKDYKVLREGLLDVGYACLPEDLCGHLKASVRVIDEVHQDFHFNFVLDLYTNVKKSISLSATLVADSDFVRRMQMLAYPVNERMEEIAYDKYVNVRAITYSFKDPSKIKCKNFATKSYSHNVFEQSVIRNPTTCVNYLKLISNTAEEFYIKHRLPGEKLIVFAASIELCTIITKYLTLKYPNLAIRRYVEEDEYSVIAEGDIIVSTILSAGTALDIPNLITVILTTNVNSTTSNLQSIGRLRYIADRPLTFTYFTCEDIDKHREYHSNKIAILTSKVLDYRNHSFGELI